MVSPPATAGGTDPVQQRNEIGESLNIVSHKEVQRMRPEFPIYVRFENGEVESYDDVEELILNLEDFDSDVNTDCEARDARGRRVRLKLQLLELKELSLQ